MSNYKKVLSGGFNDYILLSHDLMGFVQLQCNISQLKATSYLDLLLASFFRLFLATLSPNFDKSIQFLLIIYKINHLLFFV